MTTSRSALLLLSFPQRQARTSYADCGHDYSIALRTYSTSYNAYVNRNHDDRDATDYYGRQISTITVMEVSA